MPTEAAGRVGGTGFLGRCDHLGLRARGWVRFRLDNTLMRYYIAGLHESGAQRLKRRHVTPGIAREEAERALCRALLALREEKELCAFLRDLCTPAELEALCDRWQVVPLLLQGIPYRDIHERTGVSVTTIGRVARFLMGGYGGYRVAAERLGWVAASKGESADERA